MMRFSALFLAAPLVIAAPLPARAQTGLAQVQAHLRAVQTMTAGFTQTDSRGRTLSGTVTIKRPGRIRFDYGRAANMLIVGDGRALTFLDYSVNQQQRWPINDSPLSVFLNPNQDLARFARVIQDSPQTLLVQARDPRRREFGTITIRFVKAAGAPGGLILQGWNTVDAQNNRTNVSLSGQRFNVPVADSAFSYRPIQRRGPRR
jgi:outer membrane lipoprotein-sorting protein